MWNAGHVDATRRRARDRRARANGRHRGQVSRHGGPRRARARRRARPWWRSGRKSRRRFSPEIMVANYVGADEVTVEATLYDVRLRSRYDREIFRLALPALGALRRSRSTSLDTAIVGHLGRPQLAALGIASTCSAASSRSSTSSSTGRRHRWRGPPAGGEEETHGGSARRRCGSRSVRAASRCSSPQRPGRS